jgi:hypothetical protein
MKCGSVSVDQRETLEFLMPIGALLGTSSCVKPALCLHALSSSSAFSYDGARA